MLIDVVLFDADDTLWDFQVAARSVTAAVLAESVATHPAVSRLDAEAVLAIRRELGTRHGQEDVIGLRRETFRLALETVGIADANLTESLTQRFLDGMTRDLPLFPDTIPVLEELATTYRMGIVSNGTKGPEAGGIGGYFETTVLGPIEGMPKPDPRLFHLALERLGGVDPGRALMVGDHHDYDVLGAHAAGMRSVLVDRRGTGSDVATAVIRSLSQLPSVISGLAG